jgi:hypothetical protein
MNLKTVKQMRAMLVSAKYASQGDKPLCDAANEVRGAVDRCR